VHTISQDIPTGRTRRTYSTSFKSELIEQCRQVGVSCSAVAISHGLNPNVLRRWIKDAADSSDAAPPAPKSAVVDVKRSIISGILRFRQFALCAAYCFHRNLGMGT
jgi:transposase